MAHESEEMSPQEIRDAIDYYRSDDDTSRSLLDAYHDIIDVKVTLESTDLHIIEDAEREIQYHRKRNKELSILVDQYFPEGAEKVEINNFLSSILGHYSDESIYFDDLRDRYLSQPEPEEAPVEMDTSTVPELLEEDDDISFIVLAGIDDEIVRKRFVTQSALAEYSRSAINTDHKGTDAAIKKMRDNQVLDFPTRFADARQRIQDAKKAQNTVGLAEAITDAEELIDQAKAEQTIFLGQSRLKGRTGTADGAIKEMLQQEIADTERVIKSNESALKPSNVMNMLDNKEQNQTEAILDSVTLTDNFEQLIQEYNDKKNPELSKCARGIIKADEKIRKYKNPKNPIEKIKKLKFEFNKRRYTNRIAKVFGVRQAVNNMKVRLKLAMQKNDMHACEQIAQRTQNFMGLVTEAINDTTQIPGFMSVAVHQEIHRAERVRDKAQSVRPNKATKVKGSAGLVSDWAREHAKEAGRKAIEAKKTILDRFKGNKAEPEQPKGEETEEPNEPPSPQ